MRTEAGTYLAYLDVWQRHVTALEDPDIAEPALGGADTATRLKNVWQVKLVKVANAGEKVDGNAFRPPWQPGWEKAIGNGRMSAQVTTGLVQENQLYRVEIHAGGNPDQTTVKWSCDNGAVAARVSKIVGNTITLSSGGREAQTSFPVNQWIELTHEERTLQGRPGILVQLASVQGDDLGAVGSTWPNEFRNIDWTKPWPGDSATPHGIIARRWDSKEINVAQADPILLDNIQVQFETGTDVVYKSGDFWLIPARQLTGTIEWPRDADGKPLWQPPQGIFHRYCGLALLELDAGGQWTVIEDLRAIFQPLADLPRQFYTSY